MQPAVIQQLIELNSQFYQSFGRAFAATRQRVQPGVARLLGELPSGDWLDLGCGSGSVALAWARTLGRSGSYTGVDFSPVLLTEAQQAVEELDAGLSIRFIQGDLGQGEWWQALSGEQFDVICAFAVLHHIPGEALRRQILVNAHRHLAPGGVFALSVWQLQHSPRLVARIQPWSLAGLREDQVDPGDMLMDWRYTLPGEPEQTGLRYVHLFEPQELQRLGETCGFTFQYAFESDGKGGRLALYQVWANA